jgi:hypothetical protein
MNLQRSWLRLTFSASLLAALASACTDARVTAPRPPSQSLLSADAQPVNTFNGAYSNQFSLPDGYTHVDRAVVAGTRVSGAHEFSNGADGGFWVWDGTITVDPFDSNQGTISGDGTRTDQCCGSITFTVTGNIVRYPDGTAALFYTAVDPRFGPFGSAAYRRGAGRINPE